MTYDDDGNVISLSERFNPGNSDIRYSDRFSQNSLENYSKKEYNSFGWAREADAISFNELDDLYSKIQEKSFLSAFNQSSKGEAIIEVNNKPNSTLDVDNVFVFVKGTRSNFAITRVVRFQAETETEMEIMKEDIYEGRTCNDTHIAFYQEEGIAREYRREDFPNFDEYREGRSNGETGRGTDQNYRRSSKYRSGYSLGIGEDGEITESNYLEDNKSKDRNPDSYSNRSLLANALEGVAQNDIERNKLQQYKEKNLFVEVFAKLFSKSDHLSVKKLF